MFQQFMWRGEPIADIRVWARARGEKMVRYRQWRHVPSMFPPWEMVLEEQFGAMPESFFDNLRMGDWFYDDLGREEA